MMTEKRFEYEKDSDYIRDNETDGSALYVWEWLGKLNTLNEESKRLKQNNNDAIKLSAELQIQNDKLKKEKAKLKKENEQLKYEKEILMLFRERTIKTLQQVKDNVKDNSPDEALTGYLTVFIDSIAGELEVDVL